MATFRNGIWQRGSIAGAVMVLGTVMIAPPALAALDLTGTWQGKWKCKEVTTGAEVKPGGALIMTISQSGGDVNAHVQRFGPDLEPYDTQTFQGHVEELAAKPGQGASTLVGCSTGPGGSHSEALSAKVKVTSSSASFKGISAYELPATPTVGGQCKYSLKRVTTDDPAVAACQVCGNGTIEAGEACDAGHLNGETCATQVGPSTIGTLRCGAGCTFDTSECVARFVVNGDGTLTDNLTKLQWEMKDGADGGANLANPHDVDNTYTWAGPPTLLNPDGTAFTSFLAALNGGVTGVGNCTSTTASNGTTQTGGFAGHCDWRLPTVIELYSIVLAPFPCGMSPCIDPVFGPTVADYHWTATNNEVSGNAWVVHFDGFRGIHQKHNSRYVRAVRSAS